MPPTKKTSGVSVKIPRRAYVTAQRIARREQRTITTVIERAIEHYRAASEGSLFEITEGGSE